MQKHATENSKFKILITFFILLLFFPLTSQAAVSGEGLTISPPILELSLNPGESYNQTIKLTNPTDKLIEIYPLVMNFSASGEGGEPAFSPASASDSKYSLANWISFQKGKLALTPEQIVEFKYKIEVPRDAEPGGHYGVVFFGTEPPQVGESQNQVAIASMIGALILGKVPGTIDENASLVDFSAKKIYFKGPVDLSIRIKNLGNVHFKPQGALTIKSMFGQQSGEVAVNVAKGNVLPDSTRKFEEKWSPSKWAVGRFTANLALTYGETQQNLNGQLSFWLVPIWFIILIGLILLVVIVLIIWRKKKRAKTFKKIPPSEHEKVILR